MAQNHSHRLAKACFLAVASGAIWADSADAQVGTLTGTQGSDVLDVGRAVEQLAAPLMRDGIRQTIGAVQRRIVHELSSGRRGGTRAALPNGDAISGLAGGDGPAASVVWGDLTNSHLSSRNSDIVVNGTGRQTGVQSVMNLGADGKWGEFLAGAAVAANLADLDLDDGGRSNSRGFTITPYVGYTIDDVWSLDAQASYTRSSFELALRRRQLNSARGNFDSDRFVIAANANAFKAFGNWQLTGIGGLLYAREHVHDFTQTTFFDPAAGGGTTQRTIRPDVIELGQLKLGGEVVYVIDEWEPYLGAMLEADFINEGTDRLGAVFKGGFRYRFGDSTSAGMELSTVQFRDHEENYSLGVNFRLKF